MTERERTKRSAVQRTMRDVDHTPPDGTAEDANLMWERGREPTESTSDADVETDADPAANGGAVGGVREE